MFLRIRLLMLAGCLCLTSVASAQKVATLSAETLEQWRDHILPSEDDLTWMEIPWLVTFASGVQAANQADKPLLLWVMNGHPLGCT